MKTLAFMLITAIALAAQTPPAPGLARTQVGQLLLTVTTRGIEPKTMTIQAGEYHVLVMNRLRLGVLDIRLDRVTGNGRTIAVQRVEKDKVRWNESIDFTPGQYLLGDPKDPARDCVITVRP